MQDSQKFPWKRIAVEGAVIVVSILIAFGIDTWWTNRADRIEEEEILGALQSELESNLVNLDEQLAYRDAARASTFQILDAAAGKIQLEPAEFDQLLGDVMWSGWVDLSTDALASLLQSGKLTIIENTELRERLAALPYWTDSTTKLEEIELLHFNADINPFLAEHAYLPQIYNTIKGQPGIGDNPNPSVQPTNETRDHTYLLQKPKFVGMIATQSSLSRLFSVLDGHRRILREASLNMLTITEQWLSRTALRPTDQT